MSPIERYLLNHAEALARPVFQTDSPIDLTNRARIDACCTGRYRWVLIVPAFDESPDFPAELVQQLNFKGVAKGCLLIRVVNAPEDATAEQRERTLSTLPNAVQTQPEDLGHGTHMLTIDAATQPLPADKATGLARKLGNDIACRLYSLGHISMPLLCNTDADAILPADYFTRLGRALATRKVREISGWIMPFAHRGNTQALHAVGAVYELYLRSLAINLQHCGSPYAYPALGSVLAINPLHYAKSRGFPKRRAGEDFYLLNKLVKTGEVVYLTGAPVTLAARASQRVPFGTGPAISRLLDSGEVSNLYGCTSYALNSFALLRQFYQGLRTLHAQSHISPPGSGALAHPVLPKAWRDPDLTWLLKRLGLPGALVRLQRNHRTDTGLQRGLHEWFDALKVVRFLNEARHFHADEQLSDQIDHLFLLTGLSAVGSRDLAQPQASIINQAIEGVRPVSEHSVAHYS